MRRRLRGRMELAEGDSEPSVRAEEDTCEEDLGRALRIGSAIMAASSDVDVGRRRAAAAAAAYTSV